MVKYSTAFNSLVNHAKEKSDEFYRKHDKDTVPNPYYIGKGNPNAKILLLGKELAIDPLTNKTAFTNESVENTNQWKKIVDSGWTYEQVNGFNPLLPYNGDLPKSAGATWNQYQRLCNLLRPEVRKDPHFFHNFFLTEANATPSKYSPGRGKIDFRDRLAFFKDNEFYQNFEVVIVATGGYLHVPQIECIFGVKEQDRSRTKPGSKFITFTNQQTGQLVISTRQLSTSVSTELMNLIAGAINDKAA